MDSRRALPVAVAASVVLVLGYFTWKHRDAGPLEDPEAAKAGGPQGAVDVYAPSGKNKRLTGEDDGAMPPGHPTLPEGHPAVDPKATPPATSPGPGPAPEGEDLPASFVAPAGWTAKPAGGMRKAQWDL